MRKICGVLFLVVLVSCSGRRNKEIVDDGNILSVSEQDTCECDNLKTDSLGIFLKDDLPYTGVCYSNYPDMDVKYIEKELLEGKLHGKVVYYSKNGEVILEEVYEYGAQKRAGDFDALECECTELKLTNNEQTGITRYYLDDIPFTGKCTKYYPESEQVYIEANYKNGYLNGHTIYYAKDGSTLYFEVYESGVLVNTVYEGI